MAGSGRSLPFMAPMAWWSGGVTVVRFDATDFPTSMAVTGRLGESWDVRLHLDGQAVRLADVRGAYYRRPTRFGCRLADERERDWAQAEARAGLGGLLLTSTAWLNHPHR